MRAITDMHASIPLTLHRIDEFSSGLQSKSAALRWICSKLRLPDFTARIQPADPCPSIRVQSDDMTAFVLFRSALVNLIVASWFISKCIGSLLVYCQHNGVVQGVWASIG